MFLEQTLAGLRAQVHAMLEDFRLTTETKPKMLCFGTPENYQQLIFSCKTNFVFSTYLE